MTFQIKNSEKSNANESVTCKLLERDQIILLISAFDCVFP